MKFTIADSSLSICGWPAGRCRRFTDQRQTSQGIEEQQSKMISDKLCGQTAPQATKHYGETVLRRAFLFSTALFTLTACAAKAPDSSADVAKLKAAEVQWFDLYNKGDAESVANLYADDAIVLA